MNSLSLLLWVLLGAGAVVIVFAGICQVIGDILIWFDHWWYGD